jgi:hypothetical protein
VAVKMNISKPSISRKKLGLVLVIIIVSIGIGGAAYYINDRNKDRAAKDTGQQNDHGIPPIRAAPDVPSYRKACLIFNDQTAEKIVGSDAQKNEPQALSKY